MVCSVLWVGVISSYSVSLPIIGRMLQGHGQEEGDGGGVLLAWLGREGEESFTDANKMI